MCLLKVKIEALELGVKCVKVNNKNIRTTPFGNSENNNISNFKIR